MGRVCLTQEQRQEARNKKMRQAIADGLCVAKHRGRLNIEELGRNVGVGRNTMAKILSGEDVVIPLSSVLRILDVAGLSLKARVENLE